MDVLLDLWGVLTDSRRMVPAYRMWIAATLSSRYGDTAETWEAAHDAALAWYEDHLGRPEAWARGTWLDTVNRADAENLARMFRHAGLAPPEEPLALSRALEFDGMATIDAAFPDARTAVARLRRAGHRVFVSTNATESNARGALTGARLLDAVDGVFTGELLNAGKASAAYWEGVRARLGPVDTGAVVVDDRPDYLGAAASCGFVGLLMDRDGLRGAEALPPSVRATLRNLAGLPHFLDVLAKTPPG